MKNVPVGIVNLDGGSELEDTMTDDVRTVESSLGTNSNDMGAYVADPTDVNEEKYGSLDYYGQGFCPSLLQRRCGWARLSSSSSSSLCGRNASGRDVSLRF